MPVCCRGSETIHSAGIKFLQPQTHKIRNRITMEIIWFCYLVVVAVVFHFPPIFLEGFSCFVVATIVAFFISFTNDNGLK